MSPAGIETQTFQGLYIPIFKMPAGKRVKNCIPALVAVWVPRFKGNQDDGSQYMLKSIEPRMMRNNQ